MVLVQKWPFFKLCFFSQYRSGKCLIRHSRTKKSLSKLKKQEVQTVEKLTFFQWFWSKNGHFSNFVFSANIGQENVFYDILERKPIKTKSSKSRKIDIFPKGLTHGFGPKMAIFPTLIFKPI